MRRPLELSEFQAGVHATKGEIGFALKKLQKHQRDYDCEQAHVLVVGSRTENHWLSHRKLHKTLGNQVSVSVLDYWYPLLNQAAIDRQLCFNQLARLSKVFGDLPPLIRRYLEKDPFIGADIDLLIVENQKGPSHTTFDRGTGVMVDIWRGPLENS